LKPGAFKLRVSRIQLVQIQLVQPHHKRSFTVQGWSPPMAEETAAAAAAAAALTEAAITAGCPLRSGTQVEI
jgi:hypothetical protein